MRLLFASFVCLASALLVSAAENVTGTDSLAGASREAVAGRTDAALKILDDAEKRGDSSGLLLAKRGCIHLEQGKTEEALSDFHTAHEKDPTLYLPRLRLGDVYFRQKKWDEARAAYLELMGDTNVLVLNERLRYGILMTHLAAKDDDGAKPAFDRVVFPTETPAYYYAQAAWAFAHGSQKAGEKWMKTADGIFDASQTAWFARPLFDLGWIKTKPPIVLD
ncbi:MAG: tetratricopeptide repeat protein [Chthoniobacterales bacterium]